MTPGEGRQWRAEILEAVMLWTVRLGAVLVAAAFASALFAERGLL